ncbi:general odorant-binding protein 56a-like isoform X2 [Anopheles funestus]|uniref:general odorant-binding protein 56a-like isoform X2 n=1 Tax=Anopheles funestus TaxID=62324 RepID=UPI0020C67406|nr:general odorant-binding protein 56a-like isoform X2 [Anopheles funestus]
MAARVLIAFAILTFAGLTVAQKELTELPEVKGYKLHCIESSGITESSAKKLSAGESIKDPDQATKCFVQCFFQKLRLMDETGVVLKDKLEVFLTKLMDADKAKDYVSQCDLRRTNPCDTAYAVYDCYLGKKAKLF